MTDEKAKVPGPDRTMTDGNDPDESEKVPDVPYNSDKFPVTTTKIAKGKGALHTENVAGRYGKVFNMEEHETVTVESNEISVEPEVQDTVETKRAVIRESHGNVPKESV